MASSRTTGTGASAAEGPAPTLRLRLPARGGSCPITLGAGALAQLPRLWRDAWDEAAIIGDEQVLELYGERVARLLAPRVRRLTQLSFPPGEQHKTRQTKARLEDALLDWGAGRGCCVVALGGGISLDLAGFVAATTLRGLPHINLPSSLLAQVDAAIGGKTGVNTPHGKNLVGVIRQPALVLVDTELLSTLPREQWAPGLAETVKHAVIADPELFAWLEQHADQIDGPPWRGGDHPILRCLAIKGAIVEQDEQEHGLRQVLNFGHTVGHALEKALGHQLDHGRAVAVGMLVEGRVAQQRSGFAGAELERLRQLLGRLGLPQRAPGLPFDQLEPFLALDKKRRRGELQLALPRALGQMDAGDGQHAVRCTPAELRDAWAREAAP